MLTYVRTGTAGGIFIQIMQINNKMYIKYIILMLYYTRKAPLLVWAMSHRNEGILEIVIRLVTTVARKFI
jgi:hypothetical protein